MTVTEEQLETLGRLVDTCENLLGATKLPLPPAIHVEGLTGGVTEIRDTVKELFFALGGDKDTWS